MKAAEDAVKMSSSRFNVAWVAEREMIIQLLCQRAPEDRPKSLAVIVQNLTGHVGTLGDLPDLLHEHVPDKLVAANRDTIVHKSRVKETIQLHTCTFETSWSFCWKQAR